MEWLLPWWLWWCWWRWRLWARESRGSSHGCSLTSRDWAERRGGMSTQSLAAATLGRQEDAGRAIGALPVKVIDAAERGLGCRVLGRRGPRRPHGWARLPRWRKMNCTELPC